MFLNYGEKNVFELWEKNAYRNTRYKVHKERPQIKPSNPLPRGCEACAPVSTATLWPQFPTVVNLNIWL